MKEVIFSKGAKQKYSELNGSKVKVDEFFNSLIDGTQIDLNCLEIFKDDDLTVYSNKCGIVNVIFTLDKDGDWFILDFLFDEDYQELISGLRKRTR